MSEVLQELPQELYDEVVEMTKEGFPIHEIVEETGLTQSIVRLIRRDSGFHGRVVDPFRHLNTDDIIQRYRDGQSVQAICVLHEISRNKFYKLLAFLGEPARRYDPVRKKSNERVLDEAVNMYEAGYYIYEIELETGVRQPQLHTELHKRGVPLRQPRSKETIRRTVAQIGGSRNVEEEAE